MKFCIALKVASKKYLRRVLPVHDIGEEELETRFQNLCDSTILTIKCLKKKIFWKSLKNEKKINLSICLQRDKHIFNNEEKRNIMTLYQLTSTQYNRKPQ